MEPLPKWLQNAYSKLFNEKGSNAFRFEEAARILGAGRGNALSILSNLSNMGTLAVSRSALDEREKEYRLVEPNDLTTAQGIIASLPKKASFNDRVNAMDKRQFPYLVVGEHAVSLYTNWLFAELKELRVRDKDYWKWFAFLRDRNTLVLPEKVTRAKAKKFKKAIRLYPGLTDEMLKDKKVLDGLNTISPERLIVELVGKADESSLQNALAAIVSRKRKTDWAKLKDLARGAGVERPIIREIGFLMDALNKEAKGRVIPEKVIKSFRPKGRLDEIAFSTYFSQRISEKASKLQEKIPTEKEKQEFEKEKEALLKPYEKLGKEWYLKVYLPRHIFTKIVEDLVK